MMEDEYLALSGIQHFAFCIRQWALIHMEDQWQENYLTAQGRMLHARVDDSFSYEKRKDTILVRGLPVASHSLRLYGVCDMVEYTKARGKDGMQIPGRQGYYTAAPVEYKRGKHKENDCDRLQLCAQAICLEEMGAAPVEQGYIYYAQTRRRESVELDASLKHDVVRLSRDMWSVFSSGKIPRCTPEKKCKACSLKDICLPVNVRHEINTYLFLEEP